MLSVNSAGVCPKYVTPEGIHIMLPPHGFGSTEVYADFIVQSPNERFVNVVRINATFAFRVEEQGV